MGWAGSWPAALQVPQHKELITFGNQTTGKPLFEIGFAGGEKAAGGGAQPATARRFRCGAVTGKQVPSVIRCGPASHDLTASGA